MAEQGSDRVCSTHTRSFLLSSTAGLQISPTLSAELQTTFNGYTRCCVSYQQHDAEVPQQRCLQPRRTDTSCDESKAYKSQTAHWRVNTGPELFTRCGVANKNVQNLQFLTEWEFKVNVWDEVVWFHCCFEGQGGFPGGTSGKEPACRCRRPKRCGFDLWVRRTPCRRA